MSEPKEEKKSPFRRFRKGKDDGEEAVVRKTKTFKRIRGLLSGESRKQRRERKAKERAAKNANAPLAEKADDDQSTVYNVDVEDRSVFSSKSAASSIATDQKDVDLAALEEKKPYMLKVVLLLMDPETRRFELLQLEFDSLKALVSDVLAQIPVSVTEEALRKQTYTSICGQDGKEMSPDKLLSNFCKGNDVLVAIPTGIPAKECARLARPILSDEKVVAMVSWAFTKFMFMTIQCISFSRSSCCPVVSMPRRGVKTRRRSHLPRQGRKKMRKKTLRRLPRRLRSLHSSLLFSWQSYCRSSTFTFRLLSSLAMSFRLVFG
jgi:hypothetical protein